MAEPIRVDFQVGGIKHVLDAFRSIIDAQQEMEKAMNRAAVQEQKAAQASTGVKKKNAKEQEQVHAQSEKAETQVSQAEITKRDQVDAASVKKKGKRLADGVAAHKSAEEAQTKVTENEANKRVKTVDAAQRRLNQLIAMHQFRAMSPEMQRASLERAIQGNDLLKKRYGNNPRALSVASAPYAVQEIAAMRDWNALSKKERNALRKSFKESGQHLYLVEEIGKYKEDARGVRTGERLVSRIQDKQFVNEQRQQERAQNYVARLRERHIEKERRQRENAEKYVANLRDKHVEGERKQRERAEKYVANLREKHLEAERKARVAAEHQLQRDQEAARRHIENSVRQKVTTYTGAIGQGFRAGVGGIVRAGGLVSSVLGGFSVADSVQNYADQESVATQIELNTKGAIKGKEIRAKAADIGMKTGVNPLELLKAYAHFVEVAGDEKGAKHQGLLNYLTQVHLATGVDLSSISEMAARMTAANDFDDPKTLQDMLAMSVGVGRKGSVDIKHYAPLGGRLVGSTLNFADRPRAYRELLGIAQLSGRISTASTPAEIMISLPRLQSDLARHSADLIKAGVNPYEGDTNKLRPVSDILIDVVTNNSAAREKIQKIFNERSIRAVEPFMKIYNDSVAEGKDPVKEMRDALAYYANDSMTSADVQADAARKLQDSSNRMAMVLNELRERLASELVPLVKEFLPKLKEMIPTLIEIVKKMVQVAEYVIENPKKSAAMYVGGNMVGSVASTAIGMYITNALTSFFTGRALASAGLAAATETTAVATAATTAAASTAAAGTVAAAATTALTAALVAAVAAALGVGYKVIKQELEFRESDDASTKAFKLVKNFKQGKTKSGQPFVNEEQRKQEAAFLKGELEKLLKEEKGKYADSSSFLDMFSDNEKGVSEARGTAAYWAIKNLTQAMTDLKDAVEGKGTKATPEPDEPPVIIPFKQDPNGNVLPWSAPVRINGVQ